MSDYRAWAQAGWVWHCCVRQEQERVHWTHGEVEDWEGCGPADRESCARILWGMMSSESVNNDKLMCNSVDLRPCDCAGCGRPTRLSVWCPRAGAGHCWNSGDWFIRLEKQYRIQRRYFFFFYWNRFRCCFTPGKNITECVRMLQQDITMWLFSHLCLWRLSWQPHSDSMVLGSSGAFQ